MLFLVLLGIASQFFIAIHMYAIQEPSSVYPDGNESEPMMCHCYLWGCYCCPEYYDHLVVYDLNTNQSDIAIYEGCRKIKYMSAKSGKRSIDELKCKELLDYYDNGRRCRGFLKTRCIYPHIWNKKTVLKEQIRVKNCTLS